MDKNYQDKTESKRTTTEDKLWLPPLSPQDQKKLDRLRNDRKKTLIVFGISAAFAGLIMLIYIWFILTWPLWVLISLMLIGIVLLILLIRVGYTSQWTGLKGKTLWDWLQLLGVLAIPIVVAGATLLFSIQQAQNSLDQQRATILQTFIDNIQDLLLNHNLLKSNPDDLTNSYYDVAILARARTLTALQDLDPERKGRLLVFLHEAELIGDVGKNGKTYNPIINLSGADLTNANLFDANLIGVNLIGAHLSGADLTNADLTNADLFSVNLIGVKLTGINLSGADLRYAYLDGAKLFAADLSGADLTNAELIDADLNGVQISSSTHLSGADLFRSKLFGIYLSGADLNGVDLRNADLTDAKLDDANLSHAYLTDANLNGAVLNDAKLRDAYNLTQQQLDQVYTCKNAILPPGLTCNRNQSYP